LVVDGNQNERASIIKKAKNFDLIITSYSSYQRDSLKYKKEKITFNYAVLDEAQYIKNFKTRNAQIVKEIDADFRLALTGTPLENSISEIWSIFEFLMPGFLGKQSEFTKNFIIPIVKNGEVKKLKDLRKKISIFMLRRTKESVLKELPEKTVQNLSISLSEDQNLLYQEVLSNIKSDLLKNMDGKSFGKSYMNILAALTKLRQICNHPNLILKNEDHKKYSSAKLDLFLNLVSEIKSEGRKVLVFSQFKTMLGILKKELDEKKIKYSYLAGETKNRKEIIDEFNSDNSISVFLISLKAGGVGINLTSADNVILFDP
jgi:SNF2 family DNA or RNA helicase